MTEETREIDATFGKDTTGAAIIDADSSSGPNEAAKEISITAEVKVEPKADVKSKINVAFDADGASLSTMESEICIISNKANGSSGIVAPPRRLQRKAPVDRRRKRHPVAVIDRDASRRKYIVEDKSDESSEENFGGPKFTEERSEMQEAVEESDVIGGSPFPSAVPELAEVPEVKEEDSSAIESKRSPLDRQSTLRSASNGRLFEMGSASRSGSRIKKRKAKGSLRNTLERKVEAIERIVEDHVEWIWRENVGKHSWLQPIDSWIVDHCKPSTSYTVTHCQHEDDNDDRHSEPTYDFKFTAAAAGRDEEPRIESGTITRIDDSSLENRIMTHLRKLRDRAGSSRSNRFEPASAIARLEKEQEALGAPPRAREENNPNMLIDPDILEVKEVKRYGFLDKLKDNVKEKMEDVQRVH